MIKAIRTSRYRRKVLSSNLSIDRLYSSHQILHQITSWIAPWRVYACAYAQFNAIRCKSMRRKKARPGTWQNTRQVSEPLHYYTVPALWLPPALRVLQRGLEISRAYGKGMTRIYTDTCTETAVVDRALDLQKVKCNSSSAVNKSNIMSNNNSTTVLFIKQAKIFQIPLSQPYIIKRALELLFWQEETNIVKIKTKVHCIWLGRATINRYYNTSNILLSVVLALVQQYRYARRNMSK